MKLVRILMVLLLTLTGCATQNDVSMNSMHMLAEIEIAQAKAEAIQAQAGAIQETITADSSELERHLAREQIVELEVTQSGLKAPTNGNDVAKAAVKEGGGWLKTTVGGVVIWRGIDGVADLAKSAGSTDIKASEGSTVNLNKNEKHTTAIGRETTATSEKGVEEEEVPIGDE